MCKKTVYPMEFVGAADKAFHKRCFKCRECSKKCGWLRSSCPPKTPVLTPPPPPLPPRLSSHNYCCLDDAFFCKSCYTKAFNAGGGSYGKGFKKSLSSSAL